MRARISFLTRKAKGGVGYRDEDRESDAIRFGRATDSEVYLPDARVNLQQAAISQRPGGLFIEAVGAATIRHNGAPKASAPLAVGDTIGIGPYDVVVVEPAEGYDVAVTVELVRPEADELAELRKRSITSLAATGLSKRRWAWGLSLLVFAIFLVFPLINHFVPQTKEVAAFDVVWDSGPMSSAHRFFGADCQSCHQQPFIQVRDGACLACHADIEAHAPHDLKVAQLEEESCGHCHKEHTGNDAIVITAQSFCSDCHADLKALAPQTALMNATDFGRDHPEFRPTVMQDPPAGRVARVSLEDKGALVEHSNLKFPHDKHLAEKGVRAPAGTRVMGCQDCHTLEPGGVGMAPITMERHCSECHTLKFDAKAGERTLPHGNVQGVVFALSDFYAAEALRGGFDDEAAPAVVRRRPGQPLREEEKREALAWAEAKAAEAADIILGTSLCKSCHIVERNDGKWTVQPVRIADRWMPKGSFVHEKHATTECVDCHKQAKTSTASSDVMLPDLQSCRTCHGGEHSLSQVASTCTMCHVFHVPALGPMHPDAASKRRSAMPRAASEVGTPLFFAYTPPPDAAPAAR